MGCMICNTSGHYGLLAGVIGRVRDVLESGNHGKRSFKMEVGEYIKVGALQHRFWTIPSWVLKGLVSSLACLFSST